jgi:hypothetical protein
MSGTVAHYLMKVRPEVAQFQVYQPDREHIEFSLICRSKVDATWVDNLLKDARYFFSDTMQISIKFVDKIELTSAGKYRFVISEVRPEFL